MISYIYHCHEQTHSTQQYALTTRVVQYGVLS